MKIIIIHMVDDNEYQIKESESFDNSVSFSLDEFAINIAKIPTNFARISKSDGYVINSISTPVGYNLKEVTFRIDKISSIDLVEVD